MTYVSGITSRLGQVLWELLQQGISQMPFLLSNQSTKTLNENDLLQNLDFLQNCLETKSFIEFSIHYLQFNNHIRKECQHTLPMNMKKSVHSV